MEPSPPPPVFASFVWSVVFVPAFASSFALSEPLEQAANIRAQNNIINIKFILFLSIINTPDLFWLCHVMSSLRPVCLQWPA